MRERNYYRPGRQHRSLLKQNKQRRDYDPEDHTGRRHKRRRQEELEKKQEEDTNG